MSIALGIDTGGTYTDAVLVAYETGQVLATAKALTTRRDLSVGIREAVERVFAQHDAELHLVSLSTTLATNAIVEGQGAPIGALLLGYGGRLPKGVDLARELGTSHYALIPGGHTTTGEEWQPLDMAAVEGAMAQFPPETAAIAISGYFGTRNPAHELAVRQRVQELTDLPVTCGHELTHRLDALRRATTVALNASLIPLLCQLIDAVQVILAERGVHAPLMVVKGDGSLMDAKLARQRPIETILSGPAASVVGAQHLVQDSDVIVVDMGGTTTDIAVIEAGGPRLSPQGAQVGRWRTMVEAIDVHTSGLGGDSRIWLDETNDLQLGPRRVIPLALLASQHPEVLKALRDYVNKQAAVMPEFWVLQRDVWPRAGTHPPFEAELQMRLRQGPLSLAEVHRLVQYPQLYNGYLGTLERQGVVLRAGLTPTDAAHLTGSFEPWDGEASRLGMACLAFVLNEEPLALAERIMTYASELIAGQILAKLLADDGANGHHTDDLLKQHLIARAMHPDAQANLQCRLSVRPALVAIGAPAPTYFGKVAEILNARLYVPEHAGVANALGAVAGSVVSRVRATILPQPDEGLNVHLPDEVRFYLELEPALAYATERVQALALANAEQAGAQDIRVSIERQDKSAPVANGWGDPIFLQSVLVATAVGRPRLAKET